MPLLLPIHGSNVRDYAMLERNLLTHLRFAMVLSLLSSSVLLNARLPSPSQPTGNTPKSAGSVPLASIHVVTAVAAVAVGLWEYERGFRDMQRMRAFLVTTKPHIIVMSLVSLVVFATCIVLMADKSL